MRNLWDLPLGRLSLYCQQFDRPPEYIKISSQASCNGPDWIGMERNFRVIEETLPFRILSTREKFSLICHHLLDRSNAWDLNAVVLIDYLNKRPNFFHWFLDALPKVIAAEMYTDAVAIKCNIIVPKSLQPWQSDSMRFMGINPDLLIEASPLRQSEYWEFKRLITTFSHRHVRHSPSGHFDSLSLHAIQLLVNRLIKGARESQRIQPAHRRLYISRGNVQLRKVTNEEEIMGLLSKYDFELLTLDKMPLHEQIQHFSLATHVISAHGGALTNLAYISPGCQVLEIFQTGHGIRPDFFQLTAIRGGIYSFHVEKSLNENNDIEIPLNVLRSYLDATL